MKPSHELKSSQDFMNLKCSFSLFSTSSLCAVPGALPRHSSHRYLPACVCSAPQPPIFMLLASLGFFLGKQLKCISSVDEHDTQSNGTFIYFSLSPAPRLINFCLVSISCQLGCVADAVARKELLIVREASVLIIYVMAQFRGVEGPRPPWSS